MKTSTVIVFGIVLLMFSVFCHETRGDFVVCGTATLVPGPGAQDARFYYVTPDASQMFLVADAPTHIYRSYFAADSQEWTSRESLGFPDWATTPFVASNGDLYYAQHMLSPYETKIYRASPTAGGWAAGVQVEGLNGPQFEHNPYFDGQDLYFADHSDDIMIADYDPILDTFSEATYLDSINDPTAHDIAPWVSADGLTMLFASDRDGGYGGYDLYSATRSSTTSRIWTNITNLGAYVNTPDDELNPVYASGTQTLYFSRGEGTTEAQTMQAPVPEPSITTLFVTGIAGLLLAVGHRKRRIGQR